MEEEATTVRRQAHILQAVSYDEDLPIMYHETAWAIPVTLILIIALIFGIVQPSLALRDRLPRAILVTTIVFEVLALALGWVIPIITFVFCKNCWEDGRPQTVVAHLPFWMRTLITILSVLALTIGLVEDTQSLNDPKRTSDTMKILELVSAAVALLATVILPFFAGFILLTRLRAWYYRHPNHAKTKQ